MAPPPPGANYPHEDGMFTPPGGMPPMPQSWRRQSRLRRPAGPLAAVLVAAVLAIIVVIAVVVSLQGSNSPSSGGTATGGGATPSATAKASATAAQRKQAAAQLVGLLSQSGSDRGAVVNAVVDVEGCGKTLAADSQTFTKAAANRRILLSKLSSLAGRSALPAAMVTDLTSAWQASAQADSDLAKWATAESTHGCHKNKTLNNPNYTASLGPDNQATNSKAAFTKLWNPLARKDGLPTYTVGQL